MTEAPSTSDYQIHYYKQKLAAAVDESAQLFAQANMIQQQVEAEKKRADDAEAKLAQTKTAE